VSGRILCGIRTELHFADVALSSKAVPITTSTIIILLMAFPFQVAEFNDLDSFEKSLGQGYYDTAAKSTVQLILHLSSAQVFEQAVHYVCGLSREQLMQFVRFLKVMEMT